VRRGRRLGLEDFDPCTVLLNNDLSAGLPDDPQGPARAGASCRRCTPGWAVRRKSNAFRRVRRRRASKFAKSLDIDPWLVNP
jgi:glutamate--cysteine ligase